MTAPTKTQQVLQAYVCGEPKTYRQVAAETGVCLTFVSNIGTRLQRRKYLQRAGECDKCLLLSITPAGARHAKRDDYMVRECRAIEEPDAEAIVESAKRSRSALAMVWRAGA